MDDARLRTAWQQRQFSDRLAHLSEPLTLLMKHTLAKRVRQLSKLGQIWDEIIPEDIAQHTALESFSNGVLTVMVDSAPHRFQLQTLMRGGLFQIIQQRFSGAIRKVNLTSGQFCSVDLRGEARYEF